jgi:O-methyltransferase
MKFINLLLGKTGFRLVKKQSVTNNYPADFDAVHKNIINKVRPYTMTSQERIFGLIEAVNYISKNQIAGCVIECGVWKGGSMLAIAETLVNNMDYSRNLYLYDTFDGMSEPTEDDRDSLGNQAASLLANEEKATSVIWAYSGMDEVKTTMKKTLLKKYTL